MESFDFQLAGKLAQVINFSALADKTYGDADYSLSATASSGLPITFSSSNSTVVSVSGSTATVNNAGESLIYASQAGNATYALTYSTQGTHVITWNFDDGNENSSQCVIIVTVVGDSLIVETEGTYQWINCDDNSIIDGQTGSSFAPGESGEYAVIVTQGECSDTSECYSFTVSGLVKSGMNQDFEVYPIPVKDFLTIDMAIENTNAIIRVVNIMGQTVVIKEMDKLVKTNLDVSRFDPGVYLMQIKSDQLNSIVRVIKE